MINRATSLMGEARGLNQSQKLINNHSLTKVHESFVNHALNLSKSKNSLVLLVCFNMIQESFCRQRVKRLNLK